MSRQRSARQAGRVAGSPAAQSGARYDRRELGERGIDLADVSAMLGHRDMATTRRFYQGILSSRLKGASDTLAGRFEGWQAPDPESDAV